MGSVSKRSVLVIGASGIVGKSAIQEFINAQWETHGISRRNPQIVAPEYEKHFDHHKLDLFDKEACARELLKFSFVTHILYSALIEQEGDLMDSWQVCNKRASASIQASDGSR
jgi:nucleoside-diphosphate-sugar epimerase